MCVLCLYFTDSKSLKPAFEVLPFSLFTSLFYGGEIEITLIQSVVGSVSNIVVLLVIGIPLLKVLAARNARGQGLKAE